MIKKQNNPFSFLFQKHRVFIKFLAYGNIPFSSSFLREETHCFSLVPGCGNMPCLMVSIARKLTNYKFLYSGYVRNLNGNVHFFHISNAGNWIFFIVRAKWQSGPAE